MAPAEDRAGVLSLSSRVGNGWVGNTLVEEAARTLAPGIPLHTIDTVQWTAPGNHPRRAGPVLDPGTMAEMLDALLEPGPHSFPITHLLTGYLRTASQVEVAAQAIAHHRSRLGLVLVDPVLGDHGRLYVAEKTARAVGRLLVPRADHLLPNITEAAYLAGSGSGGDAEETGRKLLKLFPNLKGVGITSAERAQDTGLIGTCILTRSGGGIEIRWTEGQRHEGLFHGTGDFFAGAVMALMSRNEGRLGFADACDKATRLTNRAIGLMSQGEANLVREAYDRAMQE